MKRSHRLLPIIGITRSNSFFKLRVNRLIGIMVIGIILLGLLNQAGEPDKGYEIVFKTQDNQINPYQEEYEKMLYPTVRITSSSGTGSGVVISYKLKVTSYELKPETCPLRRPVWATQKDSEASNLQPETFILTAAHVVDNQSVVNIELYDSTIITGTVIITDTIKDLALIRTQINADLTDLQDKLFYAKLASRDYQYFLFNPVYAIGCSLGLSSRPSSGIITAINLRTEG
ncbi:MAG: S1C family serine protease, partial [Planctomycetota bacterium]